MSSEALPLVAIMCLGNVLPHLLDVLPVQLCNLMCEIATVDVVGHCIVDVYVTSLRSVSFDGHDRLLGAEDLQATGNTASLVGEDLNSIVAGRSLVDLPPTDSLDVHPCTLSRMPLSLYIRTQSDSIPYTQLVATRPIVG
jgi:hypothetical protein